MHLETHIHTYNIWLIMCAYALPLEKKGPSKAEGQAAYKTKLY